MKKRPRIELLLVALLFLGPLALAWLTYFGPLEIRDVPPLENPDRELLAPPVPLPRQPLQTPAGPIGADWALYRWSLIYARISPCRGGCAAHLERLTQVYLALGRDSSRARRVFLTADGDFRMAGDPGLVVGYLDGARDADLVRALGRERLEQGRIYIVDPLGNIAATYPPDADQARLLEDIERLLEVSGIG